ncbi:MULTISPECIES: hypothetical protein [Arsenophonus]|uniref:hypothetical protein n=1 Tax=Arsenophonus TaxID=637 RepID=UPI0015D93A91|nr:hypothetical protein [Arsenophonus endosymbiont of Apis mellifera]
MNQQNDICLNTAEWIKDAAYQNGMRVKWNNAIWQAKWWIKGTEPGYPEPGSGELPWEKIKNCDADLCYTATPWLKEAAYQIGAQVKWNKAVWEAKWWSKGTEPGFPEPDSGEFPWRKIKDC